jgi:S-adenosylmethionine-diacylgycerolhomoserine-N-methlytransferase
MSTLKGAEISHATLMNDTYRYQRWIYDASRKYFLFGRDHLIAQLDPPPGGTVLEIGCGTGRNLELIGRRYPDCQLYGLDISSEMLRSARAKLGERARLVEADATDFETGPLFDIPGFDRVVLSFALSMIPDWQSALERAVAAQAPDGSLHVVDFGSQKGLPGWFRTPLNAWLGKFHVAPRRELPEVLADLANRTASVAHCEPLHRDYTVYATLRLRSGA